MRLLITTLALLIAASTAAQSTTIVDVTATATTTVTQTATNIDGRGPCDGFYGACVVYGGYGGPAAYTTTVYATGSSPRTTITTPTSTTTFVTSTSTIMQTTTVSGTTTVSNSGACNDYDGACVVYGSGGTATSTVYAGSSTTSAHHGNGDGEIGETSDSGNDGAIGNAASTDKRQIGGLVAGCLVMLSLVLGAST